MNKKKNRILIRISMIMMMVYFTWRLVFTFPIGKGCIPIVMAAILFICEAVSAMEAYIHLAFSTNPVLPKKPQIPKDWYPHVDVFIATHNESTDILFKTLNGCKHMRYPDKEKVHIWICDDGNRQEMKELAEKMGVGWLGLANNKLAKAGNLNNAISKTSAPLIATFDADMIPTRDFLLEAIPYFYLPQMKEEESGKWVKRKEKEVDPNYKIGFIQTPQSFYNPDLFQYNLFAEKIVPNEQDYFFREINVSRNKSNSPIYAGSNTVISRKALEEVGGIATGTITEDFETGLHIQERGYLCYAIDKVLAHGLAPNTIDSLIKQRERWGRGCIDSLRKAKLWKNPNISFTSKLNYAACQLYWWTFLRRFVFILSPILYGIFAIPVMQCEPWEILTFWLPFYFLFNKVQRIASGNIRNMIWSNIIDTILFPYLIIPIVLEAIGIHKEHFVVTQKDRIIEETDHKYLIIPHSMLLGFGICALLMALHDLFVYGAVGSIIIIYWLCVNNFSLLMAVFFMMGRRNYRRSERFKASLETEIIFQGNTYCGTSFDLSENGIAVDFKEEMDLPQEPIELRIKTEYNSAKMMVKKVYSKIETQKSNDKKNWRYCFEIESISEEEKTEYYQIIYDREPSLPRVIEKSDSIFHNISTNLIGRMTKTNVMNPSREKNSTNVS